MVFNFHIDRRTFTDDYSHDNAEDFNNILLFTLYNILNNHVVQNTLSKFLHSYLLFLSFFWCRIKYI